MPRKPVELKRTEVSEWPTISENEWYVLALVGAIGTAIAIALAYAVIFFDGFDGDPDTKLAQALAPFGVALFAVVTFCTVCWRGSITTRQVNQAEAEGRAKLLQEGAKLLGETGNPSHVSAGLATLEILVTGTDEIMAIAAMNLIADFVQTEMASSHEHRFSEVAFQILENGEKTGRTADRALVFTASGENPYWKQIHGVESARYTGGTFQGGFISPLVTNENRRYVGVRFEDLDNIFLERRFFRCIFVNCSITEVARGFIIRDDTFEDCDFSKCIITEPKKLGNQRDKECYYLDVAPPISDVVSADYDWSQHFVERHTGE